MNKRMTKKKETFRIKDIKAMKFDKGDTIVVSLDRKQIDARVADLFLKSMSKQFPDNKVIALINGMTVVEFKERYNIEV